MKNSKIWYFIIAAVSILFLVLSFFIGYECPIYKYLHIKCPACGSRDMVIHLLHFNIIDAFLANPLVFILLIVLFIYFMLKIVFKKKISIPNYMYYILIIIILIFTVIRNLIN